MKRFLTFVVLAIVSLFSFTLYKVNIRLDKLDNTLVNIQLNQYLIQKYIGEVDDIYMSIDSIKSKLANLEVQQSSQKKVTNNGKYSRINQYNSKKLPSKLVTYGDWIEFCGTKYNPEPSQCYGNYKKTATGKSVYDLINDPYHLGIAITKIGLQSGFRMHDTVDIQYMDSEGNWHDLKSADGKTIRGLIEDRMSPRLNDFYCLDILTSKEKMSELPFTGLAKIRIKK